MSESTDIIVKTGSVEVIFDDSFFPKDQNDPKMRRASDWKITQVVVTGESMNWSSEVFPQGADCTIRIVCKR